MVPAVALTATATDVAMLLSSNIRPLQRFLDEAQSNGKKWVEHVLTHVHNKKLNSEDALVWAAYHASWQPLVEDPPALCALLTLFYEKAATPAVIRHGMDVQR